MAIMQKKRTFTFIILILITAFLLVAALVPRLHSKEVEISYITGKVIQQINDPEKLTKWFLPFAEINKKNIQFNDSILTLPAAGNSLKILKTTPFSVELRAEQKSTQQTFLFKIRPHDYNTIVTLLYSSTLLNYFFGSNEMVNHAEKSLANLKAYMEDTKQLYGYDIKETLVTDTSFLFSKKIVASNNAQKGTKELFDMLIKYGYDHHANYNGVRIFHSELVGKNETEIYAGIGVNRRIETFKNNIVQYKMMPYKKKLLAAYYEGPYGNISKVYNALEEFKQDHHYSSMAIPFEKFLSDGYGFADTQVIKLRVCYPVF